MCEMLKCAFGFNSFLFCYFGFFGTYESLNNREMIFVGQFLNNYHKYNLKHNVNIKDICFKCYPKNYSTDIIL